MSLFDVEVCPYTKESQSIMRKLASRFETTTSSKYSYFRLGCQVIESLYNGNFFVRFKPLDLSKGKDFDLSNAPASIESCKGDWIATKKLVLDSFDNLQLVKKEEYLPYGKKFYENLKFSGFFGGWIGGHFTCPFYYFISPPRKKDDYFQGKYIDDLEGRMFSDNFARMVEYAESLTKQFRTPKDVYYFWLSIEDMYTWWKRIKNNLPDVYSVLKEMFGDRSLLEDYFLYLREILIGKEGGHYILSPWYFKVGSNETNMVSGYFASYLKDKAKKNNILRSLPKHICSYYCEESFRDVDISIEREMVSNLDFNEFVF